MPRDPAHVFRWPLRVYYEDTDFGGVVYYANYLRYFEHARTEWLRALGIEHQALARDAGLQFVVRRAEIDFLRGVHVRVEFPAGTWSPWVREHGAREAFEAQASDPDGRMRARMDDLGTRVDLEVTGRASAVSASCLPDRPPDDQLQGAPGPA